MDLKPHPPERRRRGVVLAAHGCCCCCCCCLHSLGGIIGTAVASAKAHSPEARRTVRLYWWLFLASSVLGLVSLFVEFQREPAAALIIAALGLPLAQWNASFLTLCVGMMTPLDLRTLGSLTWKGFLWALIGFLIMAVPTMLLSYLG